MTLAYVANLSTVRSIIPQVSIEASEKWLEFEPATETIRLDRI